MDLIQNIGTILSQLVNTLIGGHPDETLSARSYYESNHSQFWAMVFTVANMIFGPDHCYESAKSDYENAQDIIQRFRNRR